MTLDLRITITAVRAGTAGAHMAALTRRFDANVTRAALEVNIAGPL
jgi:hypothetical protein